MLQQYEMMHNDVSSTKNMSLDQAQSLNVELGLDFGLIPSIAHFKCLHFPLSCTGIPRLARFWWQDKNCVRWNSCYASQKITFYTGCPKGIVDILKNHHGFIFDAKEPIQAYSFEFIFWIRKWLEKKFQKNLNLEFKNSLF